MAIVYEVDMQPIAGSKDQVVRIQKVTNQDIVMVADLPKQLQRLIAMKADIQGKTAARIAQIDNEILKLQDQIKKADEAIAMPIAEPLTPG